MKNHIHLLSTLLLLSFIVSCQKESSLFNDSIKSEIVTKASSSDCLTFSTDYEFLTESSPNEWANIIGIDNRFDACTIPDDKLEQMGTKEMANLIVHFPLNYLVFAYNDPREAVKLIFERSTLHRQFVKREDAAMEIVPSR